MIQSPTTEPSPPTSPQEGERGSWTAWHQADRPIRIGVSACLLGENVRHDGGHARDRFVLETLGQWVEFVTVCPEMEIGMGAPRPTIRLVEGETGKRLVAPSTGEDFTDRMRAYGEQRVAELQDVQLDGFVLKKGSPSCGLERIRVYRNGMPANRSNSGFFAAALMEHWPLLPLEEEGRLNDARLRENFIERLFCRNRWRTLVAGGLSRRRLVEFHTAHKLLLQAHNESAYRRLGRLVGSAGTMDDARLYAEYEAGFQEALRTKASTKKHTNVLQHAFGHLKTLLKPNEKRELLTAIEDYRRGLQPLIVPLTLMRYEIRRLGIDYLAGQLYFEPHPKELMLRNHV
jgi:uncharacterized protein YbgA (DUF1722 family)/uncharacterized protein YbbK (DUF523 family)